MKARAAAFPRLEEPGRRTIKAALGLGGAPLIDGNARIRVAMTARTPPALLNMR